jgi:mycobactin polyketide synthetase MbtD
MVALRFPDNRVPVLLSAHTEELLATEARSVADYLDQHSVSDVAAVAGTLLRLRRRRRYRAMVRATDCTELRAGLRALADGADHPLVARSSHAQPLRAAFVVPGNGNQWPTMGDEAYRLLPVYRDHADRCALAFMAAGIESPLSFLNDGGDRIWSQMHSQSAQFTHAVALAAVWQSLGVMPSLTLGHSLGEIAAAYLVGAMTLSDAVAVVIARAGALDSLAGDYAAATLGMTPDEAQQRISTAPGWLELSVVNAAASVVVSGDRGAVTDLVADVAASGRFARVIAMNFPAHTSALEPLRDRLLADLPESRFEPATVLFVSSVTADVVSPDTEFGEYWYRNLRDTVRFDRAATAVRDMGANAFVELSAHPALLFALADCAAEGEAVLSGSGRRDESLVDVLSGNVAAIALADPEYDWARYLEPGQQLLRGFPNAPMRAVHLWADPHPLPKIAGLTTAVEQWVAQPETAVPLMIRQVCVIELPGPGSGLADQLRAAVRANPGTLPTDEADADLLVVVAPMLDHPDVESAAADIAELIGSGLFGYADAIGPRCRDVWLVTVGGEQASADEPVALPAQAALGAAHRSIGFDHPEPAFRHLDLSAWELDESAALAAIDTMLCPGIEVALRDSVRHLRALGEEPEPAPWDRSAFDDVVITGGNGAVGMHFLRYLVAAGARRIVLLSRNPVDDATLAEFGGTEVLSVPCDITVPQQVTEAAAAHGGAGATLVIHTAGAATFGTAISSEEFANTAAAKLSGLARFTALWPIRPEGRILLCSSVSGLWGGRGHAAYSAVNRMQDVMAGQLRVNGQAAIAVRWGLWPGAGIADSIEVARIERAGLQAMDADAAIEAALRDHRQDPLVFSADAARLRTFLGDESHDDGPEAVPDTPQGPLDAESLARSELAVVLKHPDPAGIDLTAALFDLGLDSLLALDLRKRLRRACGRSVPLADLMGGITGTELVALLEADATDRSEKVDT